MKIKTFVPVAILAAIFIVWWKSASNGKSAYQPIVQSRVLYYIKDSQLLYSLMVKPLSSDELSRDFPELVKSVFKGVDYHQIEKVKSEISQLKESDTIVFPRSNYFGQSIEGQRLKDFVFDVSIGKDAPKIQVNGLGKELKQQ